MRPATPGRVRRCRSPRATQRPSPSRGVRRRRGSTCSACPGRVSPVRLLCPRTASRVRGEQGGRWLGPAASGGPPAPTPRPVATGTGATGLRGRGPGAAAGGRGQFGRARRGSRRGPARCARQAGRWPPVSATEPTGAEANPIVRALVWVLRRYQCYISPARPPVCRFTPSCSSYAIEALRVHGLFEGTWRTAWRLLRCAPWHPGGNDPVPPRRAPRRLARSDRPAGTVTSQHPEESAPC